MIALLAGCSSLSLRDPAAKPDTRPEGRPSGGYYKDDGPGANPPSDLAAIPDAAPRAEPLHRYANRPYTVLGKSYTPMAAGLDYRARGLASWYGRRFHGKPTSSGEPYDMYAMTAAHTTLPIPSYVRVSNPKNGKSAVVRVNDRGPFHDDRIIDLSYTAAWKLGLLAGVSEVEVEKLDPATFQPDPAAIATADPVLPGSGLYLQLAALSSPEAAGNLIRQVRDRQHVLQLPGLHRVDSGNLYKVQAGPFEAADVADSAARAIAQELGLVPYRIYR